MNEMISPKYQMKLLKEVNDAIWAEFSSSDLVLNYISKWHEDNYEPYGYNNNYWENFTIQKKGQDKIDLIATLNSMDGATLLKVAIDLGVDTPDFIPSIPTFKNELKSDYKTSYDTFQKANRQIESDPSLESIIKEILKNDKIQAKLSGGETLYKLTSIVLKEFKITSSDFPKEIKTIGNSLLSIAQAIETLRSEMTHFHGKTDDDKLIDDTIFAYFLINSVSTVGIFLKSFLQKNYPKEDISQNTDEDLPF
jgi:hypothetical protein